MATLAPPDALRWRGRVPATLPALAALRVRLTRALEGCGWDEREAFPVLVCADEAAANALTHGSDGDGSVTAGFSVSAVEATIVFGDDGARREAIPDEPSAPDDASEHGRGLLLMRTLSDGMSVRQCRSGTVVRLGFHRPCVEVPPR